MSDTLARGAGTATTGFTARRARLLPSYFRKNQGFNAAEHRALGDAMQPYRATHLLSAYPADWDTHKLHLAHGRVLSYGEIIALAGDLYGDPDQPISSGRDQAEQRKRFRRAFNRLNDANQKELDEILAVMNNETDSIEEALLNGVWPPEAYGDADFDTEYDDATHSDHRYQPYNRYGDLAMNNFDHFGPDAIKAYKAGHHEAIEAALAARHNLDAGQSQETVLREFELALAMNAFADHYLTDLFASGHLRVPRRELDNHNGVAAWVGGAVMAKHHHLEDNAYGLFVSNARGARWQALGDAHMMTPAGQANRLLAIQAVQTSFDEVWFVFENKQKIHEADYGALTIVPDVQKASKDESSDMVHNDAERLNYVAQFIDRGGRIYLRHPMKHIDSTGTMELPTTSLFSEENSAEHVEDELWNHYTGHKRQMYGPPKSALPKPAAPTMGPPVMHNPRPVTGPTMVRYAIALIGRHIYPDGSYAEFVSEPSAWGPWWDRQPNGSPNVRVSRPPVVPNRAHAVEQMIIRQFYGQLPQVDYARIPINGDGFGDGLA